MAADNAALARWGRLALKELRETLRDRRTMLTLVGMPLLVYPLLGLVFQKFILSQHAAIAPQEYHVALRSAAEAEQFRSLLTQGEQRLGGNGTERNGKPQLTRVRLVLPPEEEPEATLEELVRRQRADLGVRLQQRRSGRWRVEFVMLSGWPPAHAAQEHIEDRLQAINDAFVDEVFAQHNPPLRLPVNWTVQTLAGSGGGSAFSLASIVPLILILMTVTGAVYPAIDLTAGERERGTLEALIAAPVPRYQVLCAKYVAVLVVVLLTAIANLTAMTATAFSTGLEQALFGEQGLSPSLLAKLLGLLTVFAAFFSAVILTLTSIARSFKEAQAYLIPLMLASLAPGVLALFPGLDMNALWAVTPLANMVLLARELFDSRVTPVLAILTLASTIGYAGVALAIAARVFGTDAVLYGSAATWSDLMRRPEVSRAAPDWTLGVVSLAGILPAYVLLSGIPARMSGWTAADRLAANALVLVLLFAAWPAALCWQRRINFRSAFQLTTPGVLSLAGAACLGASLWPFVYELLRWTSSERVTALAEKFPELIAELQSVPLGWKLTTLAAVPAVCEELYFRGFLYQSLRRMLGPWATIGVTATVFGLFHLSVGDAVVVERLLPTLLMGLVLGWVRHHSGSLWPGMLLHVIHNAALLTVDRWFPALNPQAAASTNPSVGLTVLAVAGVTALVGSLLVRVKAEPRAAATVDSKR